MCCCAAASAVAGVRARAGSRRRQGTFGDERFAVRLRRRQVEERRAVRLRLLGVQVKRRSAVFMRRRPAPDRVAATGARFGIMEAVNEV